MKHLLDVNILLAAVWDSHVHHARAFAWLEGKQIVLTPLAELGFIRVSSQPKGYNFPMEDVRLGLAKFRTDRKAALIADDLYPLESHPKTSAQVPDHYLADLAVKHGLRFAIFHSGIKHPAAELII